MHVMEAFTNDHLVATLIMCTCVGEKKRGRATKWVSGIYKRN
jgi:hypothetical protein